jgi:hypothetical protein
MTNCGTDESNISALPSLYQIPSVIATLIVELYKNPEMKS